MIKTAQEALALSGQRNSLSKEIKHFLYFIERAAKEGKVSMRAHPLMMMHFNDNVREYLIKNGFIIGWAQPDKTQLIIEW